MRIVFAVSATLFLAVIARVTLLQTVQAQGLLAAGTAQRTSATTLRAGRGTIFDRNGTEMAISVPATTLTADPRLVVDPAGTAQVLAQLLGLPADRRQTLQDEFTAKSHGFVYVARQVGEQLAAAVMALKLPGIESVVESRRALPSGGVGVSLIGLTNIDGKGIGGLEQQYDEQLTGVDGRYVREHDSKGRSIPGAQTTTSHPVPGQDLQLTIDRSLQYQAEQLLMARVEQLKAKGATAIVFDTHAGDIYAVANVDRAADGRVQVSTANKAAVEAHEPGSVAKVFSLSAAMNEGISPQQTLNVPGSLVFDKGKPYEYTIYDAESHDVGPMTVHDIIVKSSNIGTWLTVNQFDPDKVGKLGPYFAAFGLAKPTGLDLEGESSGGFVRPVDELRSSEKATVTYGYGYSATSFQLVAAVNAVANGGVYVAPKVVKATIDAKGSLQSTPPSATRPVISANAASEMTAMMRDVVCKGTGTPAQIPGMAVAGKTGTSYKIQKNGTYTADDGTKAYYATFVGYLPAADPKITVLVSIDEPDPTTNDRFGGTASGPAFADVAKAAIHELQIAPTPNDPGCSAKAG